MLTVLVLLGGLVYVAIRGGENAGSSSELLFSRRKTIDLWYTDDSMTDYLELVKQRVNFKKWFFGHYHDNKNIGPKEILIYEQIIRIL